MNSLAHLIVLVLSDFCFLMIRRPPRSTRTDPLFPYTTHFRASGGARLFNSALETGVRSALILDAARPRSFDLAHLTWLDHLVVHTADIGGPPSLHPDIPQRDGELLVRRRNVEAGLVLMRRLHMIVAPYSERSEEHTYELQSLMRNSSAVLCLKKTT